MKIIRNTAILNLFLSLTLENASSFSPLNPSIKSAPTQLHMSTVNENTNISATNDFNGVPVAKTGGKGVMSTSQEALQNNLSLGAPGERPKGGHFLTKGGVQITAQVNDLLFVNNDGSTTLPDHSSGKAIEDLVDRLDSERGVLLSSSYEFPGRYVFCILKHINVVSFFFFISSDDNYPYPSIKTQQICTLVSRFCKSTT